MWIRMNWSKDRPIDMYTLKEIPFAAKVATNFLYFQYFLLGRVVRFSSDCSRIHRLSQIGLLFQQHYGNRLC